MLLGLWAGCVPTVPSSGPSEEPTGVAFHRSTDLDTVSFHIPFGANMDENLMTNVLTEAANGIDYSRFLTEVTYDSVIDKIATHFSRGENLPYRPHSLTYEGSVINLTFVLDRDRIAFYATSLAANANTISFTSVSALNPDLESKDSFDYLPDGLLLEPCPGVSYPKRSNLIPNAPRTYRSGTHRGIDFPAPFSSQIRAVADGVVIRADLNYSEVTNEFRESLLEKAAKIGRTPSDIFEHILFGQAVFLDHGIELVEGKRLISIYAHMSEIADGITVGTTVERGQIIGKVGNSGTSDGAKGNRKGAHLHYELIIQDQAGERYIGQGLDYDPLTNLLDRLFISN